MAGRDGKHNEGLGENPEGPGSVKNGYQAPLAKLLLFLSPCSKFPPRVTGASVYSGFTITAISVILRRQILASLINPFTGHTFPGFLLLASCALSA